MKEVKRLKQEMLKTPGWNKRRSVEIAVLATESTKTEPSKATLEVLARRQSRELVDFGYTHDTYADKVSQAINAAQKWLGTGQKNHLKLESRKAYITEYSLDPQEDYFAIRTARYAINAARAKTEKKAAKKAAKAINTAALAQGWRHEIFVDCSLDETKMSKKHYRQELQRLRAVIFEKQG